ncbi:alpha-ketoglutarate dehydrogenase component 4 [Lepisosteus oculatus]|uniref:Alpha-ketoglutarate dehydrogenase subunit 4 n=1 Tax=Lepisosteus oculatus TaxID=7918 RepID=W5ML70_LEPOC|nr:PREDICTED: 28S ribosomal protein S36, mitochondrial [Lepisosteus oculatus]
MNNEIMHAICLSREVTFPQSSPVSLQKSSPLFRYAWKTTSTRSPEYFLFKFQKVTMGSKMAAASRVVQAVRPHAPLIKFPDRRNIPRPEVQEALKTMVATPSPSPGTHNSPQSLSSPSRPPGTQSTGPPSHKPGPPDTAATIREFPQRYRRRTIATEEMDYIQRGGPE